MTRHDPALSPAAELRANVALPFGQAVAMPKAVYTSAEFADLERQHIFARDWLCVFISGEAPAADSSSLM